MFECVTVVRHGRRDGPLGSMPVGNLGIILGGCRKKTAATAINGDSSEVAKAQDIECTAGD